MEETILYTCGGTGLYVNLTNECPCACEFCIRNTEGGIGEASLWMKHQPTAEEVIEEFKKTDLSLYSEIVFCGYGEPLSHIDDVVKVCTYLRSVTELPLRVNTNGLSDLINERRTAPLLSGLLDAVSISLNASTAEKYCEITHSKFGNHSFQAMLDFAADVKQFVPDVAMSVVDVIPAEEIEACRRIAEGLGIHYRVRTYSG